MYRFLLSARIKNISKQLKIFGLSEYFRRIIGLGIYRYYFLKLLRRNRLKLNYAIVFQSKLFLPTRRGGIAEELLLFGVHEPESTAIYQRQLRPKDRVLDVGTNIGYYIAVASPIIREHGSLIGIEPDPELYQCAKLNSQFLLPRLQLYNVAASKSNGEAAFYRSSIGNWGALIHQKVLRPTETITVKTVSIDRLCAELNWEPTIIRMDIEGAEIHALEGAKNVLSKLKPKLFIELHLFLLTAEDLNQIFYMLSNFGYRSFIVIDRYFDWPWSLSNTRRLHTYEMYLDELFAFTKSRLRPNVLSIFTNQ